MYKCGWTTETLAKSNKNTHPSTFRWAWSWSADRWDWRRDTSGPGPGSKRHGGPQDPCKTCMFISPFQVFNVQFGLDFLLTLTDWRQSRNQFWKWWMRCAHLQWLSPVPLKIHQKKKFQLSNSLQLYTITDTKLCVISLKIRRSFECPKGISIQTSITSFIHINFSQPTRTSYERQTAVEVPWQQMGNWDDANKLLR